MRKFLFLFFAILILTQFTVAIPAFARKYGYSCEVCHAPFPHLKAFGIEFMDNGYRIPDKEPPRATIDTGDPILMLQRELPLAIRLDGFIEYEKSAAAKPDIRSPFVMKILSGGNISKSISYYTYFMLTEEGRVAGLEDAYLAFNDVFGLPLSFVFGQYRVSDPIKPSEIRLTFEDYRIYKFRVGQSEINLSYERGVMAALTTKFNTDLVLQVVNGNGIDTPEIFDKDKYKSFVWRVAQSLSKDKINVGVIGYHGKEETNGIVNTVSYFGPDVRLRLPGVEFMFEYVRRKDSNPFFGGSYSRQGYTTDAYLGELIVSPSGEKGRLFFVLAYNQVNSSLPEVKYQRVTLNMNYLLRRNLKWVNEYTHDLDGDKHKFLTGLVVGF